MVEWSLNPLVAIGIAIAVMFFGYFFGLFEDRGKGYKKRKKEEIEEKKHQPAPQPLSYANPPMPSDEVPVLNVSLDTAGKLRLKLDGKQIDTPTLDSEQRRRLIAVLTQMRPWVESPRVASPPNHPQPAPAPKPGPAPVPQTTATPPDEDDDDELPVAQKSIVMQIDSVLQTRLVGTPLAEKGIRLQESLDGGVIVWVGVQKYLSVDDVPDEPIKAAIKAAIAEWENKYTPGH